MVVCAELVSTYVQHDERMISLLRTELSGWTVVAVVHRLQSILDFDQAVVLGYGCFVECGNQTVLPAYRNSPFTRFD